MTLDFLIYKHKYLTLPCTLDPRPGILASRVCEKCQNICGSRGGNRGSGPSPEKLQKIVFLSNTGPDPLKDHKAAKPGFVTGPTSARQRNAILVLFGSSFPLSKRSWSSLAKLSGSAHAERIFQTITMQYM